MRIISKFKDYYDGVQGIGFDDSVTYVREHRVYRLQNLERRWPVDASDLDIIDFARLGFILTNSGEAAINRSCLPVLTDDPSSFKSFYNHKVIIGLCGKFYFGYRSVPDAVSLGFIPSKWVYDPRLVNKYATVQNQLQAESVAGRCNWYRSLSGRQSIKLLGEIKLFNNPTDVFHHFNSPVLALDIRDGLWVVNPCLQEYGFQRVLDSFHTFQEIEMYLGGVLGDIENPTINISDTDMRDCKGFDNWSFKNKPTKKR